MNSSLIRAEPEITGEWLGEVLGREGLQIVSVDAIGTGQMSQSHRVRFSVDGGDAAADGGEGTDSVVVKLASNDSISRATGVGMGAYRREVSFYRNLAARIGGPLPSCHLAEFDEAEGWFTLVLEDIVGATQGDQIAGCSVEEAQIAIRALARIQAPVLNDLALATADYLNLPSPLTQELAGSLLPGFLDRYGSRVKPEHADVCRRFVAVIDAWAADRRPPLGLVHGDFRLDNLLFADDTCKVVDWQTVGWGPAMLDVAYFIGGALDPDARRAHEQELVRLYHSELIAHGAGEVPWDDCWREYRRQTFFGILMTTVASMVVQQTERGDEMFMTWLARNCQQIIDLDALELLPDPDDAKPAALRPDPADEGSHPPGGEKWWNESWYFDAVSDDGQLALYTRIGRVPNQDHAMFTASVVGPGRPSIMLVMQAPLPGGGDERQSIDVDALHVEHVVEEPLQRFRVRLNGIAEAHEDASAPLRGEPGTPVQIAFDLVWETDGIPYAWRQTTRYEIPCRVTGTIRIGEGEEVAFSGPGQRDHSWGARDWFAADWMWSALHLGDGTRIHAVGVPQMPGYGVGYIQHDGELTEIASVRASEHVAGNGLITDATVVIGPEELRLEIEPLAFGAILLESDDGRTSHFPRAMCRVRTDDGRSGTGWIEWNRNQPRGI